MDNNIKTCFSDHLDISPSPFRLSPIVTAILVTPSPTTPRMQPPKLLTLLLSRAGCNNGVASHVGISERGYKNVRWVQARAGEDKNPIRM